jgi:hypothetical protein
MPPSKGIPPSTSLLASNISRGASRAWLEPWPYMGASLVSLTPLLEGSYRTLVEGQLSIP